MSEYKQEAISRLSNTQLSIKGFTITITTATVLVEVQSWFTIFMIFIILISLWMLDAYYLSVERSIRGKVEDFGERQIRENETIFNNMLQKSVRIFHLPFVLLTLVYLINTIFCWV